MIGNRKGFTLVEILVASAIFVIVVVIVMDLFLLFYRQSYRQGEQAQLEQSLSYVYFILTGELHSQWTIDYASYGGTITNPQTTLYLIDESSGDQRTLYLGAGQLYFTTSSSTVQEPITPDVPKVYIDSVEFYLYPSTDPFDVAAATLPDNQPAIVMFITAHNPDDATITATYQTVISTRYYGR